jgi:hypothetical protein
MAFAATTFIDNSSYQGALFQPMISTLVTQQCGSYPEIDKRIDTRNREIEMYRKGKKRVDPLLLLSIFVGSGVIASTFVQSNTTDQEVLRDLSHTPITIKNANQSLDSNILVKVTKTLPRKQTNHPAGNILPGDETAEPKSIVVNKTRIYRF